LRSSTPKSVEVVSLLPTTTPKIPDKVVIVTAEPEEVVVRHEPSPVKGKDFETAGKRLSVFKPDDKPPSPTNK
jgi:hypothetical protein